MKISVVIPAYNEEKYIEQCLQSFMEQEEKADEIIVVDNNSKDATADIAKKFRITVIKELKQGVIPARNRGFDTARFEVIARCDADTIVPPDWIKKIKKNFISPEIAALTGPTLFYDIPESMKQFVKNLHKTIYFKTTKFILGHEVLFGSNMAIRKSAWEKIKHAVCMDDRQVHEDVDLSIHCARYGIIMYDDACIASIASRRLKNVYSVFFEYPYRWVKTLWHHAF